MKVSNTFLHEKITLYCTKVEIIISIHGQMNQYTGFQMEHEISKVPMVLSSTIKPGVISGCDVHSLIWTTQEVRTCKSDTRQNWDSAFLTIRAYARKILQGSRVCKLVTYNGFKDSAVDKWACMTLNKG